MIEGHTVTSTNPFKNTKVYDIGWNEWEAEYEEELQDRPNSFYLMEDLKTMAKTIKLRDQAKALDPNTKEHSSIRLRQRRVVRFGGSHYKYGSIRIHTDTRGLNEFGEVCPKNKDGSLESPFLASDHPKFHALLDFGFQATKATDVRDARAKLSDLFTMNFDLVGLPFWKHTHPQPPASTPRAGRKKAPTTPAYTTPHASFVGYATPEGDENEMSPKIPPMPRDWQGTHASWLQHVTRTPSSRSAKRRQN